MKVGAGLKKHRFFGIFLKVSSLACSVPKLLIGEAGVHQPMAQACLSPIFLKMPSLARSARAFNGRSWRASEGRYETFNCEVKMKVKKVK